MLAEEVRCERRSDYSGVTAYWLKKGDYAFQIETNDYFEEGFNYEEGCVSRKGDVGRGTCI